MFPINQTAAPENSQGLSNSLVPEHRHPVNLLSFSMGRFAALGRSVVHSADWFTVRHRFQNLYIKLKDGIDLTHIR